MLIINYYDCASVTKGYIAIYTTSVLVRRYYEIVSDEQLFENSNIFLSRVEKSKGTQRRFNLVEKGGLGKRKTGETSQKQRTQSEKIKRVRGEQPIFVPF